MKKIFVLLLVSVLISCSGIQRNAKRIQVVEPPFDSTLIKPYLNLLPSASREEREFIPILVNTIKKFQNRPLDTTLLVVGLIDSDKINDTIASHVFVRNDTVIIHSSWHRRGEKLWQFELRNPFYIIGTSDLFTMDKRSIWVAFTIGFKYAIPRLYELPKLEEGELPIHVIVQALKNDSVDVDENSFKQYMENFQGSRVEFSDPEIHPTFIWYEPKKMFVLIWVG
jgi:hypothetical protein